MVYHRILHTFTCPIQQVLLFIHFLYSFLLLIPSWDGSQSIPPAPALLITGARGSEPHRSSAPSHLPAAEARDSFCLSNPDSPGDNEEDTPSPIFSFFSWTHQN